MGAACAAAGVLAVLNAAVAARYVAPLCGLATLLVAAAVDRVPRNLPAAATLATVAAALVLLAVVTVPERTRAAGSEWYLSDLRPLAEELGRHGAYDDLLWSLRAADAQFLARVAGTMLPLDHEVASPASALFVAGGVGDGSGVGVDTTVVPLRHDRHAVFRPFEPWVSRSPVEGCRTDLSPSKCKACGNLRELNRSRSSACPSPSRPMPVSTLR